MVKQIKNFLKAVVPQIVIDTIQRQRQQKIWKEWENNGFPLPPPHIVKQFTIKEYQENFHCSVLVETGTFMGEMVEAQKKRFKKIYSIELSIDLYNKAKDRFIDDKNITIIQGDSGKVLSNVMLEINEPAIFWLDGHYSAGITAKGDKDCPIFEELDSIFSGKTFNHVLLIDDARLFNGEGDYPTIEKLTEYVRSKNEKYLFEVKHDIIRFVI